MTTVDRLTMAVRKLVASHQPSRWSDPKYLPELCDLGVHVSIIPVDAEHKRCRCGYPNARSTP